jgi:uncharacterized protein (DUF1015 family)
MPDVRPFRALRYTSRVDTAAVIAPPYDVISADEQAMLYARSPYNVVRIEYGVQRESDTPSDNRYSRAAADLARWRSEGVLAVDGSPAIYVYTQEFAGDGGAYERRAYFCALRLEEWNKGVVKPHERTLAKPKEDRLNLLRRTRTQISPVYGLFRPRDQATVFEDGGSVLFDFEADGQRHTLAAITDTDRIAAFQRLLNESDVYIADGHHRYETALTYRDELRARAASWSGDEPENFVLMALTPFDDPGLLVLPTHRVVHREAGGDPMARLKQRFEVERIESLDRALLAIGECGGRAETAFVAVMGEPVHLHVLRLRDRDRIESLMPAEQPQAWKQLDVNVLQYGVLSEVYGIDDAMLVEGGAITYTQDAGEAVRLVESGAAEAAFFLNATPVEQVMAVADAGAVMPQKSTYFYPKLPTGLVMRALD